jgi:signal transduction histidine kinase
VTSAKTEGAAVKTQGLAAVGFGLAVVTLYLYSVRAHAWSGQMALVATSVAAWWLESQAVPRKPTDFSTAFLFYLMLALSGDAVGACLAMLAGYCVREVAHKSNTADLLWLTPVMAGLAVVQSSGNWPLHTVGRVGVAVATTLAAAALMDAGSRFSTARLEHAGGDLPAARVEARQRALRRLILMYAPVAAVLPPEKAWMATTAAPLCWALQRAAENIGFRVHAQEAVVMKHRVEESRQMLEESQARLAKASERQEILEEMTSIFARPLTPSQAFRELARVTSDVVEYRSVALFRFRDDGTLQTAFQDSPDRLSPEYLAGKREPLVARAWLHDRAYRGKAVAPGERLVAAESELVAVPLKPLGVLYFGRDDEPFSKAEASRLFFVVRRAAPALLRAEEDAATQQAFAEVSIASEQLRVKVALTSRLLSGAQAIMAAIRPEQIYAALEQLLAQAVPHQFGVILVDEPFRRAQQWGQTSVSKDALLLLAEKVKSEGRALYLPDIQTSRMPCPATGIESVLAAPLQTEGHILGVLILGSTARAAFSEEQHDYVCTCAVLAGSGLTSLALFARLQAAHQQVVQASKLSAIGRLAATVAHELNTPLAAIGLALEAVALRPEKAGEKLNRAGAALDRAREIVSGLLNHARHSGSERSLLSVPEIFRGTLELVSPQLSKRNLAIDVECPEIQDKILANMTDLQQVLINLLLNGADASQPGSRLLLFARQQGTSIELGVTDQGTGIAAEHHARLFDPFFTTKEAGLGTGLGLSVCRQLVDRHQGTLSFTTELGKGTTFTCRFPARQPGSEAISF